MRQKTCHWNMFTIAGGYVHVLAFTCVFSKKSSVLSFEFSCTCMVSIVSLNFEVGMTENVSCWYCSLRRAFMALCSYSGSRPWQMLVETSIPSTLRPARMYQHSAGRSKKQEWRYEWKGHNHPVWHHNHHNINIFSAIDFLMEMFQSHWLCMLL